MADTESYSYEIMVCLPNGAELRRSAAEAQLGEVMNVLEHARVTVAYYEQNRQHAEELR